MQAEIARNIVLKLVQGAPILEKEIQPGPAFQFLIYGEKEKFGNRYTEVNAERTHSQTRSPAWTSFPVYHL